MIANEIRNAGEAKFLREVILSRGVLVDLVMSHDSIWSITEMAHRRFNSSPPEQNCRHFADDICKCIYVNEKFCISIQVSLKFVPKGLIENKTALVQIMAWRPKGNKPLSEPMLTQFTDAYMWHQGEMS